jgi:hypothetical protein
MGTADVDESCEGRDLESRIWSTGDWRNERGQIAKETLQLMSEPKAR